MMDADQDKDKEIVTLKAVLNEDESGDATRALIQSLRKAGEPIAQALRGTLSQHEYTVSEDLLQALQSAEAVLKTVWEKLHPDRHAVF